MFQREAKKNKKKIMDLTNKHNLLTTEQLIPYIPFGIYAEMLDYKSDYVGEQYDKIIGIHQWSKCENLFSLLTEHGSKPSVFRVKPILKPQSELLKLGNEKWWRHYMELGLVDYLDFKSVYMLIKEHIDVFGLIPKGLATDINTLPENVRQRIIGPPAQDATNNTTT